MSEALTAVERIKRAREGRQKLADALEAAYTEQLADDEEAVLELETEHGAGRILAIPIDRDAWTSGVGMATRLVCLLPVNSRRQCKRFLNLINDDRAKPRQKTEAGDELGASCVVYPRPGSDAYEATIENCPLILQNAAIQVSRKVRGQRAEQGK